MLFLFLLASSIFNWARDAKVEASMTYAGRWHDPNSDSAVSASLFNAVR